MFRNSNRRVTFRPQNGQQVLVRASITLYEPRGDYQLIAESMQPAGDGLLQQQFEQLKQRLSAEGLFDQQFKQPLPAPAKRVGVITSASGAALHDILQVLQRRDPSLPIVIYPTSVQGAEAPMQIVRAIETANRRDECDVLIVGRGGGSLEDLWSFNDERVARAIFASRIPIVSAVGHETDVTIADFVADLRAPTPSAAAELVSRNQLAVAPAAVTAAAAGDGDGLLRRSASSSSPAFTTVYSSSIRICARRASRRCCSSCSAGWKTACSNSCAAARRSERAQQRLAQVQPQGRIHRYQQRVQQQEYRLQQAMERQLNAYRQRFGVACSQLETVSPLATLARGYSVTQTPRGELLKTTKQAQVGELLKTRLQDGWVESEVKTITVAKKPRKKRAAE